MDGSGLSAILVAAALALKSYGGPGKSNGQAIVGKGFAH
jgi:hypothetical protein